MQINLTSATTSCCLLRLKPGLWLRGHIRFGPASLTRRVLPGHLYLWHCATTHTYRGHWVHDITTIPKGHIFIYFCMQIVCRYFRVATLNKLRCTIVQCSGVANSSRLTAVNINVLFFSLFFCFVKKNRT